jgi:hypothetical protein
MHRICLHPAGGVGREDDLDAGLIGKQPQRLAGAIRRQFEGAARRRRLTRSAGRYPDYGRRHRKRGRQRNARDNGRHAG